MAVEKAVLSSPLAISTNALSSALATFERMVAAVPPPRLRRRIRARRDEIKAECCTMHEAKGTTESFDRLNAAVDEALAFEPLATPADSPAAAPAEAEEK